MNPLLKSLKAATFKVMEMMYFLLPEEEPNPDPTVHIGITGEPRYLVSFTFETGLARRMAMDLLNVSDMEVTPDLITQTLKETANIIAGNLLHEFDAAENRNLTMPSIDRNEVFGETPNGEPETLDLYYENQKVTASIETIPSS